MLVRFRLASLLSRLGTMGKTSFTFAVLTSIASRMNSCVVPFVSWLDVLCGRTVGREWGGPWGTMAALVKGGSVLPLWVCGG